MRKLRCELLVKILDAFTNDRSNEQGRRKNRKHPGSSNLEEIELIQLRNDYAIG